MLGLKRGIVVLCPHEKEWETVAAQTICCLKEAFGPNAEDIRHVGSTSVKTICAKPIIDIAVHARDFDWFIREKDSLLPYGLQFRGEDVEREILYVIGEGDFITHHIHICRPGSDEWKNYLRFTGYLNAVPEAAGEYETLKKQLAEKYVFDRPSYTMGKEKLIKRLLAEAAQWEKTI